MRKYIIISIILATCFIVSQAVIADASSIPTWVRNSALWWGQEQISDSEYLQGLEYLIENKMLKVSQMSETSELNDKIKRLEAENGELRNNIAQLKAENKRIQADQANKDSRKITSQSSNAQNCSGTAKCVSEKIIRVIDGDTIYTTNYKIRLALTNTPEKDQSGYSEARTFTARMCPVGSIAVIDQDDYQLRDTYGRMLANVYCGEKSLNSELLYNGYANILTEYCDSSEFSSERWALKFGCGTSSGKSSEPVKSSQTTKPSSNCDPSYPDFCIPSPPPDLDCNDIPQKRFTVLPPDPHRFDGDKDGIGCES